MDQALVSLYHRYVAAAFDRQARLAEYLEQEGVEREPYSHTTSTATLTIGDTVRFSALDVGSHAEPDDSWLWAWCHPHLRLTAQNRQLGDAVRELGRAIGSPSLQADRQFSCQDALGEGLAPSAAHVLASVVAGAFDFDAYYTIPFAHGRFAVVIREPRLPKNPANVAARILTIFPQVIAAIPLTDPRGALTAYAESYGLTVEGDVRAIRLLNGEKEVARASFDAMNRLAEMAGTVEGSPG